jgi:hypothetical protein
LRERTFNGLSKRRRRRTMGGTRKERYSISINAMMVQVLAWMNT